MMLAARTAPKGRGIDTLSIAMIDGEEKEMLAEKMKELAITSGMQIFNRDAANVLQASVIVLIGTCIEPRNISYCGLCGHKNCEEKTKHQEHPCVFNTTDLGIAAGSALSVAADNRADSRIMYTIGMAAREMNLFGKDVKIIWGIPLSATSKNPFFDRK
ncbi:MAG TPA: ferredoxin [Bacteroidales bacterium]|nr:ferredoxin [Bacteroidales bacterium]